MTPAARLQAAIELLDEIIVAARDNGAAADQIAKRYFAARRYAGSKDRRAVRELAWRAIRRFGERPENARAAMVALADEDAGLAALFDGTAYGPAMMTQSEARARPGLAPNWLASQIDPNELPSLLERASIDIRNNKLNPNSDVSTEDFDDATPLPLAGALRLPTGFAIEQHPAYLSGKIEVQDFGSQLIVAACAARPGMTVLDLCAGAGGKTLALASDMRGEGQIVASDTNRARLSQLAPRAARAGVANTICQLLDPGREKAALTAQIGKCDVVLVDAPCSGTGTWRRNPETRWRLTPASLKKLVDEQARLIEIASEMVAPGGNLVYAVCSLLDSEGRGQMDLFLERHEGWQVARPELPAGRLHGAGTLLSPAHDGCDGFFFAKVQKL